MRNGRRAYPLFDCPPASGGQSVSCPLVRAAAKTSRDNATAVAAPVRASRRAARNGAAVSRPPRASAKTSRDNATAVAAPVRASRRAARNGAAVSRPPRASANWSSPPQTSRIALRSLLALSVLLSLAVSAAPWDPGARDYVSVLGGGLRANGAPLRMVCATGVNLADAVSRSNVTAPVGAARRAARRDGEGDVVASARPAPSEDGVQTSSQPLQGVARLHALAARYAAAGFGMVRLDTLSVEGAEGAAPDSPVALEDEFVYACRTNGLRVWAEVLRPAISIPPRLEDADLLDDPSSHSAWVEAVSSAPAPATSAPAPAVSSSLAGGGSGREAPAIPHGKHSFPAPASAVPDSAASDPASAVSSCLAGGGSGGEAPAIPHGKPKPADTLFLAAPWDPRLEVLVQKRIRAWTRAFNARTGLRRADDPVYALFSLSSRWWDYVFADVREPLPDFFERELQQAWNNWLWARNVDTNSLSRMIGPLSEGEDAAQGSVRLLPFGDPMLSPRRRSAQRRFLFGLADEHFSRLAAPFAESGPAPAFAPLLVRYGTDWTLSSASSIAIETWLPSSRDDGTTPVGAARRAASNGAADSSPPSNLQNNPLSIPLIVDATAASTPELAMAAATDARLSGASILLFYCGTEPEKFAAAAAAFLEE